MPKVAPIDERLADLPIEALECRDLSHSWPRARDIKHTRINITRKRGARVIEYEREMDCLGDCGTIARETFEVTADGRRLRVGVRRYKRTKPYLLPKVEDGHDNHRVTRDEIGFAVLAQLYPDFVS